MAAILSAVLGVGGVLFVTLLQHGAKLSAIKTAVELLQKRWEENRADHKELWGRIDDHEHRITVLEEHDE